LVQSIIDSNHWSAGEFNVLGNYEERLTTLEERVDMESGLRASIDRDLSTLAQGQTAANKMIQALGNTQSEHTRALNRLNLQLEATGLQLTGVDLRFDGMDRRLHGMDRRLDGIDARLDRMDGRFDGIDARLDRMDGRFDGIDGQLTEIVGMLKARES
jgi:chromosome segregation ATPase